MAYMDQERKAVIAANLKKVMPAGWKYSLRVRHHSTLILTISEAPVDLIAEYVAKAKARKPDTYYTGEEKHITVNPYWIRDQFEGERLEQIQAIKAAMMEGNHDRSDIQTDYFDVGWYIDISFGRWDRPFKVTEQKKVAA